MIPPEEADAMAAREQVTAACETLQRLLLGLLDSKTKIAAQIHSIRKLGKSLRGGLAAFGLDDSAARSIQAINRLLSGSRDAVARANTWRKLAWSGDPGVVGAVAGLLDQQTHSASRRPPPATIHWCVERVDMVRAELLQLPADALAAAMAAGLAKLERRTYKRCLALNQRSAKEFHAARKALKAWLGASGFLQADVVGQNARLETLARLLGDEHDLAILREWLKCHGFTPAIVPSLWQTLKTAHRQTRKQVIREAAALADPARH